MRSDEITTLQFPKDKHLRTLAERICLVLEAYGIGVNAEKAGVNPLAISG